MDDRLRLSFMIRFQSLITEVKTCWPENSGEILGLLGDMLRREAAAMTEVEPGDDADKQDNRCIKEDVVTDDAEEAEETTVQADPSTSRKRSGSSPEVAVTKKARYSKVDASKKFPCRFDGCDLSFDTDEHMAAHERVHLKVKAFSCTMAGCDYSSNKRSSVGRHIREVHWRIPRGTTDDRDPDEYIAVNGELSARRLS